MRGGGRQSAEQQRMPAFEYKCQGRKGGALGAWTDHRLAIDSAVIVAPLGPRWGKRRVQSGRGIRPWMKYGCCSAECRQAGQCSNWRPLRTVSTRGSYRWRRKSERHAGRCLHLVGNEGDGNDNKLSDEGFLLSTRDSFSRRGPSLQVSSTWCRLLAPMASQKPSPAS